jgi:hypothetical protein
MSWKRVEASGAPSMEARWWRRLGFTDEVQSTWKGGARLTCIGEGEGRGVAGIDNNAQRSQVAGGSG